MKKEIVICAAIRTPSGFIIRGQRHHNCIRTASEIKGLSPFEIKNAEQGFITSENRFVGREVAFNLQQAAGIPSESDGGYRGKQLYSEDIY